MPVQEFKFFDERSDQPGWLYLASTKKITTDSGVVF